MRQVELQSAELETIVGGKVCSVFDIFCVIGEGIKSGSKGSVKPPTCSYPSAWNPAPVIRCY